jgi:hypothetical protein
MNFKDKYIKYKKKYIYLKKLLQQSDNNSNIIEHLNLDNSIDGGGCGWSSSKKLSYNTSSKITKPWNTNSNLLYIALVISQKSEVGEEIDRRTISVSGKSAYLSYGSGKLISPHISLLQIHIKENSILDCNFKSKLQDIGNKVMQIYLDTFTDITIHSSYNEYALLGKFLTRNYNDNEPHRQLLDKAKKAQTKFREKLNNYIFKDLLKKQLEDFYILKYIPIQGSSGQIFDHYFENSEKYPNSILAEGSYFTDSWTPHVSLFKTTDLGLVNRFRIAAGTYNMSYINLWGKQGTSLPPSLSYIYIAYAGQSLWIPFT